MELGIEPSNSSSRPDAEFETRNQTSGGSDDKKKTEPKPEPVYKPRGGESVTKPTYVPPKKVVEGFIAGVKKQKETGKSPW